MDAYMKQGGTFRARFLVYLSRSPSKDKPLLRVYKICNTRHTCGPVFCLLPTPQHVLVTAHVLTQDAMLTCGGQVRAIMGSISRFCFS